MNLTRLEVSGFGVWSGLELRSLSPQLTVIYGANEAGKTTLLECLRGVLYGFSPTRRDRYLPPLSGGKGGASLGLGIDGQSYSVTREDDGSRLLGGVTVTGPDGSTQGESQLAELLSGIDEAAFKNVFAVGLRELQELATLHDGEAAAWLYDLSTGLAGISVSEVLRELRASRTRLISQAGGKSQVIELVAQRDALRADIEELSSLHDQFWRLSTQRTAAGEAVRAAEASQAALSAEIESLDAALAVREPWRERYLVEEKIAAYRQIGEFPTDAVRRLDALLAGLRKAQRRRAKIKRLRRQLRSRRRQVQVNERLCRQAARIAALAEHEPWVASLEDQLHAAERQLTEHKRRLADERVKCGLSEDAKTSSSAHSAASVSQLREPARQIRAAKKRLREARAEYQSLRQARLTRRDEVATALAGRGESSLAAALEQQGERVSQYRRRLLLDDRLDQMALHREELEDKHGRLVERQVLPLSLLIAIAVAFVCGGGLLLAGLIIPWGIGTAIVGGVIAAAAAASKFGWERSAARRLESVEKQLKMLKRQVEQSKAERSELDAHLPAGGGAITSRLQAAEAELASLEELLSIDARRQAANDEAAAAKARLKATGEEWNGARRRWQQALVEADLPSELTPAQVKQIFAHAGSLQALEREVEKAREERDRARRELAAIGTRIDQVAADAGWEKPQAGATTGSLVEQLRSLRRELAAQDAQVEQRRELDEQIERLGRQGVKYSQRARKLARRRRELYRAAGALDEIDFRRRAAERAELDELVRRRAALCQQIQAALQGRASEQDVAALLAAPSGQIEAQRAEAAARRQATADDIRRLLEQCGRITHEQALLADDRRLATKQLELSTIDERLSEAAARWQMLAITEYLIETIKEDYERNRQPEVLQEASQYLQRMTEGKYCRIWTPLDEQVLRVDDENGRALAVELLSTGAREQLFLSLRLALVSRFARAGKSLPLVLDDVLVNFDKRRAAAAAAVFTEFACAGHQLLVFTCHDHIADLFRGHHCDVRSLPANIDASPKVLEPQTSDADAPSEPPRRRRDKRPKEQPPPSEPSVSQSSSESAKTLPEDGVAFNTTAAAADDGATTLGVADELARNADVRSGDEHMLLTNGARQHRADPPHRIAPVKAVRRRWSAEEFEGELQDQVNAVFEAARNETREWRA